MIGPPETDKEIHNRRQSPTSEGVRTTKKKSQKGDQPVISEGANVEQTRNITSKRLHTTVTVHVTA